ncbi:hypothetical protein AQZ50_01870 [Novosphingobium sp. Fuku2-ISO-50]|nr:hypothetical protein AQZ50_01870 [Novosphingobium sp. Fuku2-ISO-50]
MGLFAGLLLGTALGATSAAAATDAADTTPAVPATPAAAATANPGTINDADLGTSVIGRFFAYQAAEWGKAASPLATDPNAPPSRRADWAPAPETSPPYPFTEYSYGGTTLLGVNRPASVDSPLMVAIADTGLGKAMSRAHIQAYGWVDVGGNLSTSSVRQGNQPAAYAFAPNTVTLDQAVLYVERTPDTVQSDHVDWGFRVAGMYGTNYRYTASRGFLVDQGLYQRNKAMGFDMPMIYGEVFVPQVAQGLLIRFGRFISLPDIEAQLAPNNYMYTHSLAYTFDNYTNQGIQLTLAATKNLFLQLGLTYGSDTAPWNAGQKIPNLAQMITPALWAQNGNGAAFADANGHPYGAISNTLFPGATFKRDPGAVPSITACVRYQTSSARDNIYLCADAINSGTWGYNNLQWFGGTYYHKFSDTMHVALESYTLYQKHVVNVDAGSPGYFLYYAGGTPFSPQYYPYNGPSGAQCADPTATSCTAHVFTALAYWNWQFSPMNNLSLRTEYYNDEQGQRTGTKSRYWEMGLGWQHWFSAQIEVRPEVTYYRSIDANAFNINVATGDASQAKNHQLLVAGDLIVHF